VCPDCAVAGLGEEMTRVTIRARIVVPCRFISTLLAI
jgi:hypothetical protein